MSINQIGGKYFSAIAASSNSFFKNTSNALRSSSCRGTLKISLTTLWVWLNNIFKCSFDLLLYCSQGGLRCSQNNI